jgi:type VI secretion system protein ImpG
MDREFLDTYNRELALLREYAGEFAEEYPGVAERLGGLVGDRADPMIAGLLEGAAFLAARVQLKLHHEFPEFTSNLLEQLVPHYLAPTPSALLAHVAPPYADPDLREGRRIDRGAYFDAVYRERDRNVACRFRLTTPLTLWPFDISSAEYYAAPGPLQALGVPVPDEGAAGLRLSFTYRTSATLEDEPPPGGEVKDQKTVFAGCRVRDLPIHLIGAEADSIALYEQIFARRVAVFVRYLDAFGDPVVLPAPLDMIEQVGFGEDEGLTGTDRRVFRGFDLIRDFFAFPQKFLGFRLTKLGETFGRVPVRALDLIVVFRDANPRLPSVVKKELFALYAAPGVNLFEKTLDRIAVKSNQHEYHVVPDRSRVLDFEPNRIIEVYAHLAGEPIKVPVHPLYTAAVDSADGGTGLTYTIRRLPRRRSAEERRYGHASDYVGTDMFLSVGEPPGNGGTVSEISLRALCTNRHLPGLLPVGNGGADFHFLDDASLSVQCIAGPTEPREPITAAHHSRDGEHVGDVAWRLVNMLSLNHLGLVRRGAGRGGQSLRETLALFADVSDSATDRKIRGLRSVDARPIVRRIRQGTGTGAARGLEVTLLLDDKAFEGSGPFLIGAVLDRFLADYVAINHFTQTVVRTTERGEIMRWPPRLGTRSVL